MKRKTTIKTILKLLSLLAHHKEYPQYEMPKATNISYRTILRYLKPLEKQGEIRVARTEPSEKGGKDKKIYTITLKGLYHYICIFPESVDEKLVESHLDMLLAFEKWPLFVKAGLKEKMLMYIRESFLAALSFRIQTLLLGIPVKLAKEEKMRKNLNTAILYTPLFGEDQPRETLIKIYKQDKELTQFIQECFKRDQEECLRTQRVKALWENTV